MLADKNNNRANRPLPNTVRLCHGQWPYIFPIGQVKQFVVIFMGNTPNRSLVGV